MPSRTASPQQVDDRGPAGGFRSALGVAHGAQRVPSPAVLQITGSQLGVACSSCPTRRYRRPRCPTRPCRRPRCPRRRYRHRRCPRHGCPVHGSIACSTTMDRRSSRRRTSGPRRRCSNAASTRHRPRASQRRQLLGACRRSPQTTRLAVGCRRRAPGHVGRTTRSRQRR